MMCNYATIIFSSYSHIILITPGSPLSPPPFSHLCQIQRRSDCSAVERGSHPKKWHSLTWVDLTPKKKWHSLTCPIKLAQKVAIIWVTQKVTFNMCGHNFFWNIFNFSFFHAFKMWRLNVFNLPGVTVFCVEPHITSHRIFRRRHAARRTSLHFVSLVAWVGGSGFFCNSKVNMEWQQISKFEEGVTQESRSSARVGGLGIFPPKTWLSCKQQCNGAESQHGMTQPRLISKSEEGVTQESRSSAKKSLKKLWSTATMLLIVSDGRWQWWPSFWAESGHCQW